MYNTAEKALKDQVKLKNFGYMHFYLKDVNLKLNPALKKMYVI